MALLDQQRQQKANLMKDRIMTDRLISAIYLPTDDTHEINTTELLTIPNADVVIELVQKEINELTIKLEDINKLKQVEKPLKKRLTVLNSFLTKLEVIQEQLDETKVSILTRNVENIEPIQQPSDNINEFLPQRVNIKDIRIDSTIFHEDGDLETYRLKDFET